MLQSLSGLGLKVYGVFGRGKQVVDEGLVEVDRPPMVACEGCRGIATLHLPLSLMITTETDSGTFIHLYTGLDN